mmetsp:Transcript_32191/g.51232  ORF Transcript_32191/g.51232 Transcript_32191/m.51232 type:complete len:208 (-) Transcript_32191:599-1222(-)
MPETASALNFTCSTNTLPFVLLTVKSAPPVSAPVCIIDWASVEDMLISSLNSTVVAAEMAWESNTTPSKDTVPLVEVISSEVDPVCCKTADAFDIRMSSERDRVETDDIDVPSNFTPSIKTLPLELLIVKSPVSSFAPVWVIAWAPVAESSTVLVIFSVETSEIAFPENLTDSRKTFPFVLVIDKSPVSPVPPVCTTAWLPVDERES